MVHATPAAPLSCSLQQIQRAAQVIDPVFLHTPQFVSEPLSAQLGCSLTLKVETVNPVRSFKGRGASFFVETLADARPMVCASAGNFGQALAWAARRRGQSVVVYAAHGANPLKLRRMRALGAEVRLAGEDFDDAKGAARDWAEASGAQLVVDGLEPALAEGAGTLALELLASGERFDEVVVPLGNGALLLGVARWVKAVAPSTKVIGVCSRGAPAMAQALFPFSLAEPGWERPHTIADGIAVRVPIGEAVAALAPLVDEVLLVSDEALLEAMELVRRQEGLVLEPAGAAGLAALVESPRRFAGHAVATPLCGSNALESLPVVHPHLGA